MLERKTFKSELTIPQHPPPHTHTHTHTHRALEIPISVNRATGNTVYQVRDEQPCIMSNRNPGNSCLQISLCSLCLCLSVSLSPSPPLLITISTVNYCISLHYTDS